MITYRQILETRNMSCREAGEKLGVSRQRIHQLRTRYKIPARKSGSPPKPENLLLVERLKLEKELSTTEAAKLLGVPAARVYYLRKHYGLVREEDTRAHYVAEMSEKIIETQNLTHAEAAKKLGVPIGLITRWRHRLGISHGKEKFSSATKNGVIETRGLSVEAAAKQLGVRPRQLKYLRQKLRVHYGIVEDN